MALLTAERADSRRRLAITQPSVVRWRGAIGAFGIYLAFGVIAFWHVWANGPAGTTVCGGCGDIAQDSWFLAWTPFALVHGHSPLFSTFVDVPSGVNLAVNATLPLPGMLLSPITALWGPVASLNVLMTLAFPISATAMFVVLRRWVTWTPAAFVGGLLYGFSSFMVAEGAGHLNLTVIAVPPLLLAALDELLVRQRHSPIWTGVLIGLLAATQMFISTEVLAITAIVAAIGLLVLVVTHSKEIAARAHHALVGIGVSAVVLAVVAAYPAWLAVAGPRHIAGPIGWPTPLSINLLGPLVPTAMSHFTTPGLSDLAARMFGSPDVVENGAYLGVPLLLFVGIFVWRNRRLGVVTFSAVMGLITFVLAQGPRLRVGTIETGLRLPSTVLGHLPLTNRILPARFMIFVWLFVAIIVAVGLDRWRARVVAAHSGPGAADITERDSVRRTPLALHGRGAWVGRQHVAIVIAVAAILVPLVPRWPYGASSVRIPQAMTAASACPLAGGGVLVTYPTPSPSSVEPMLWQAANNFCYKTSSAYLLGPLPDGRPDYANPVYTAGLLEELYQQKPVVIGPAEVAGVRQDLHYWGARAVVVIPGAPGADRATALFTAALQRPPEQRNGAAEWSISP